MTLVGNKLTPVLVLNLSASLLLFLNLILYLLRTLDSEWWAADYEIYNDVDPATHFFAILCFCIYLGIYFFTLRRFFPRRINSIERRNLKTLFIIVISLFLVQIYFAIVYAVGIAGGSGKAPAIAYVLFLFSFDGVYYAYALKEKNKYRLIFASCVYIIGNIIRGWAGFIVFMGFIYFLRRGTIDRRRALLFLVAFVCLMPVLFVVRDIFRGGYSKFDFLQDSGLIGLELYSKYFVEALKLLLMRFDFYSNFIGVDRIYSDSLMAQMCSPLQENVLFKFYSYFDSQFDCRSLGSILPGSLYDFFLDTGTSYSIVSGFFALPLLSALNYLFQYIFVLCLCGFVFRYKMIKTEYICFFVFFVFLLLFQGWMYQFTYNIFGFFVGWMLSRMKWKAILNKSEISENFEAPRI